MTGGEGVPECQQCSAQNDQRGVFSQNHAVMVVAGKFAEAQNGTACEFVGDESKGAEEN